MSEKQKVKVGRGKGIFLSIKDLMLITGSDSYNSTQREHAALRAALETDKVNTKKKHAGKRGKRKITIKEYCEYELLDFEEVWKFLRGTPDYESIL